MFNFNVVVPALCSVFAFVPIRLISWYRFDVKICFVKSDTNYEKLVI